MFSFVGECDNVEKLRNEIMASAFILCDHLTFDHWQIIMFNENKMYGFILCSSYGDSLHGYGGLPSKIYFDRSEGDSPLCDLLDYKKQLFFHTPTVCDGDESECHTKSTEPSTTELYLPLITSIPHESEIIGCLHMSKCGTFQEDINELLDCDYSKPLVISIQRDFEIIHSGYLEGRKFLNLVHIFFNIASSKDPYLEGHSYNVALLSNLLGRKLNLSNHSLNRLYMASLLHDIGKVYIPEQILNKHDSLTDEEMDIVKKHSQYGYNILNDLFFPSENDLDLADIVLQHHERYDGSGYPNGLAGKDIRLESRIIAIADSIDAMLSVHSYKEPKSLQDTIDDIVFNKGKQFDPELIKPMIEVLIRRLELQESILERPIIAGTLEILTEI